MSALCISGLGLITIVIVIDCNRLHFFCNHNRNCNHAFSKLDIIHILLLPLNKQASVCFVCMFFKIIFIRAMNCFCFYRFMRNACVPSTTLMMRFLRHYKRLTSTFRFIRTDRVSLMLPLILVMIITRGNSTIQQSLNYYTITTILLLYLLSLWL